MPISRILILALPLLGVFPACTTGIEEAPKDEACKQAGYAVASAQYACGVDPKTANAAYETFSKTYTCVAPYASPADYECAERILETPCDAALARRADDPAYLESAAACARIFRRADGTPSTLSTLPSKNPVCEQLAHRYFVPLLACVYAENGSYQYGDDGAEPHDRLRRDIFAGRAAMDAELVCLATDPTTDVSECLAQIGCRNNDKVAAVALLAAGTPCAALLGPRPTTTGGAR